jgi:mannose-6-phosphate isomerase-like protein (cupin superfamily)
MEVRVKLLLRGGHSWEFSCKDDDPILFGLVSTLPGADVAGNLPSDGLIQIETRAGERLFLTRSSLVSVEIAPVVAPANLMALGKAAGAVDSSSPDIQQFASDGFLAPLPLFTRGQCDFIRRHLACGEIPEPLIWPKGRFVTDRVMYDLAVRPNLLSLLEKLLGEDIVLWGVDVLVRDPENVHPWHTDIESSAEGQRFVSLWIGIHNTSRASALKLITRSHRFGMTLQQVRGEKGLRRGEASDDLVLAWARERDPDAAIVQPETRNGEAIVFDGRLWHGSEHIGEGQRVALLFQYTTAHTSVFLPDLSHLEWPFRYKAERVPVSVVSGSAMASAENYVVGPPEGDEPKLSLEIKSIKLPVSADPLTGWRPHHIFRGATATTEMMNAHFSVLSPGRSPHPPHAHREEEILIVLDGEAEIIIADGPNSACAEQIQRGSFAFYPAYQYHTIRNATSKPITYLMFKWRGVPIETEKPTGPTIIRIDERSMSAESPFLTNTVFEGPTNYLAKLHSHFSVLQPDAGYAPHADHYDVAMVILNGRVRTMGRIVEPCGVIFCAEGNMHDMENIGDIPAHYVVFEFHSRTPFY